MNERLADAYSNALDTWQRERPSADGVSRPFLIAVPPAYTEAGVKLMIVGQQTLGWGEGIPDDAVSAPALMHAYVEFNLAERYRSTPFWQAAEQVYHALNPSGPARGFLWSNLVKVDQNGGRPSSTVEGAVSRLGLLPTELGITRPDVVVFFTGPAYDDRIRSSFPGVAFVARSRSVSQLSHSLLPRLTFRTYHPKYLRLAKLWADLDLVRDCCTIPD